MSAANSPLSLVVGLGEVGEPLRQVLERAHRIEGIDLPPRDVRGPVDILHVCYPAEINDFVAVTRAYVQRYAPRYVVIHSTVAVGTTETVQEVVDVPVIHSPVRGKHAKMVDEMLHYVKFIGTENEAAAQHVASHLAAAGFRTRCLSSARATELAKLTETTYFGLLIAFAQDIDRMARASEVDYEEVASFYDEIAYLPRMRFFPGVIGGHCVMPNIELLQRRFSSRLLDAIQWSNALRVAKHTATTTPELAK